MKDTTIKKLKRWLTITSIVTGSLGTILTPILVMYIEYAPQVRAARGEAEATIESLAPGIVELQEIVTKSQKRISVTNKRMRAMKARHTALDRRLVRCETYMEMLGQQRNLPRPPSVSADSDGDGIKDLDDACPNDPEVYNDYDDEDGCPDSKILAPFVGIANVIADTGDDYPVAQQVPQYKVPTDIGDAKKKAAKRAELKCDPADPLCGELE